MFWKHTLYIKLLSNMSCYILITNIGTIIYFFKHNKTYKACLFF